MNLSRYTLFVDDFPEKGASIAYHTRTQAMVKLNQETRGVLERISSIKNQESSIDARMRDNLNTLNEMGIVVKDEQEERERLADFFRQIKYEPNTLAFEVTILTTYKCNFKCIYCFEESVKEDVFLDKQTSGLIVSWLIKRAQRRGYKSIFLVFYGGEPLLNTAPIDCIGRAMKQWAEANGVKFNFAIITNGSLINPALIEKWRGIGLDSIRISIDGDREAHNKKRPFSSGRGSFDVIIDNIKRIIDIVKVGIAGNFDLENLNTIPRLLDYLDQEGILSKLDRIGFSPIVPRLGSRNNPAAIELGSCLSFFAKDGMFDATLWLRREFMKRGLNTDPGMAINSCPLIMEDGGLAIDPKGVIYKCNSFLGYPEFSIGNVVKEEFNPRQKEFLETDAWKRCPDDCPYVPMCQGGCRFFSYLENKNLTDICCKRPYFDRICPELIKLDYEREKNIKIKKTKPQDFTRLPQD
ncbi:MAG: radical SAM protein [Candidatus Omnitrophota bacterium]